MHRTCAGNANRPGRSTLSALPARVLTYRAWVESAKSVIQREDYRAQLGITCASDVCAPHQPTKPYRSNSAPCRFREIVDPSTAKRKR